MKRDTIHREGFKARVNIPVIVEFEAFPECPGTREGGTGSPPDPAYIDVISVKTESGETITLDKEAMEELEYEIAESLSPERDDSR